MDKTTLLNFVAKPTFALSITPDTAVAPRSLPTRPVNTIAPLPDVIVVEPTYVAVVSEIPRGAAVKVALLVPLVFGFNVPEYTPLLFVPLVLVELYAVLIT